MIDFYLKVRNEGMKITRDFVFIIKKTNSK